MILMSILANIMNLRRQANIDNAEKYLYEIIDDYKHSNPDKEKSDIFKSFCSSIWSCENKRRVYTKTIRFSVRKDLLDTDIGQVFDVWSEVEYKGYKAMSKETDWCNLIRQKINNLYTRYFDKEVILKRDYMSLLNTPKRLYYQWIDGIEMDTDELTAIIDDAIDDAEKLKVKYQKQKMELSWNDYKKVVEGFFQRCFDNCKLIEDYEKDSKYCGIYDFMNEDNFYISYFCKSIESYMQNYQKQYYGLYVKGAKDKNYSIKRCKKCGALIKNTGNKKMYCDDCANFNKKESNKKADIKYKNKQRENRKL